MSFINLNKKEKKDKKDEKMKNNFVEMIKMP